MKVIGIVCSPRRQGNTEILVQEALESAKAAGAEVELLTLAGKTLAPCDGCETCTKTGKCHIDDDMQEVYPKLIEADGIIFGSPIYFWTITAQAKALIDRTMPLIVAHRSLSVAPETTHERRHEGLRNKVGGIIVVSKRCGGTLAFEELRAFLRIHRIIEGGGALAYGGNKGDVRQDEQGMREAWYAGRAVVRTIQQLKSSP